MAKEQSWNTRLKFGVGNVTDLKQIEKAAFDLVVDANCFHCITKPEDRNSFLAEAYRALKLKGCLVIMTMATPVLLRQFRNKAGYFKNGIIYRHSEDAQSYKGAIQASGVWLFPIRFFEHWKTILRQLKRHNFLPGLFRVNLCNLEVPESYLSVLAIKN